MNIKNIVIGTILGTILMIGAYIGLNKMSDEARLNNLATFIFRINSNLIADTDSNGNYSTFNLCNSGITKDTNEPFFLKDSETLDSNKWIGIDENYTGCSVEFNYWLFPADKDYIRLIAYPSDDKKALNVKLIWYDDNENDIPDANEDYEKDIKDKIETYLKGRINNSL